MCKSGIYQIKNIVTGKVYIGSAVNIKKRWLRHRYVLNHNKHENQHLQRSWNKHGFENFEFSEIELIEDKSLLIGREQFWMDKLKVADRRFGYNICEVANSCLGRKHTEETKRKLSIAHKGKKLSPDHCRQIGDRFRGKKLSDEHKRNIRNGLSEFYKNNDGHSKGKTLSEKHREKISAGLKAAGHKPEILYGEDNVASKLTVEDVVEARKLYAAGGVTYKDLAEQFGVSKPTIHRAVIGKTWADIAGALEKPKGIKRPNAKLTWEIVEEIREKHKTGLYKQKELAVEHGVSSGTIYNLINMHSWLEDP